MLPASEARLIITDDNVNVSDPRSAAVMLDQGHLGLKLPQVTDRCREGGRLADPVQADRPALVHLESSHATSPDEHTALPAETRPPGTQEPGNATGVIIFSVASRRELLTVQRDCSFGG